MAKKLNFAVFLWFFTFFPNKNQLYFLKNKMIILSIINCGKCYRFNFKNIAIKMC